MPASTSPRPPARRSSASPASSVLSPARRAAAFLARGDELRSAGRLRQAAECYRQSIAYDGAKAAAHLGLGLALWDMDRRAEAIARLEDAVALDPRAAEPARRLADAYTTCGHPDAARKYRAQAEAAAARSAGSPVPRSRAGRRPSLAWPGDRG